MSRTIQSTQQLRGRQIQQTERKNAQSGKALPSSVANKKTKMMKKGNPSHG